MAKRGSNPYPGGADFITRLAVWLAPRRREAAGTALLLVSVLSALGVTGITSGAIVDAWSDLLHRLFGIGALPVAAGLGMWGGLLLFRGLRHEENPFEHWDVVAGLELAFVAALGLAHMVLGGDDPQSLADRGGGGGYLGWGLGHVLSMLVGRFLGGVILVVASAAGVLLATRLTPSGVWEIFRGVLRRVPAGHASDEDDEDGEEDSGEMPGAIEVPAAARKRKRVPVRPDMPEVTSYGVEARVKRAAKKSGADRKRDDELPPHDLLELHAGKPASSADARYQAQVIEETLEGFGIPARVVEISQGPAVTQFGVEPGYIEKELSDGTMRRQRVRVRKISSLAKDLALALAAAPIRIEAPVPGKPVVGIEVPNSKISLVSLRSVVDTDEFRQVKGPLPIPLGRDVAGLPVAADLAAMPHLLIAGATGSGKSVCLNSIITGFLLNFTPDELELLMIDPKMVELTAYNGVPHLLSPVVTDLEQATKSLYWVTLEMEKRYRLFAGTGARGIESYNKKARKSRGQNPLPYMVVIIDELADLMMIASDETERFVTRIAQMARATGIHLVIATQRPSVDVVTGLIKANFPARIAFAVTSMVDSRVIIDTPGAESLLGRGDMLLMLPDSSRLRRLQGCFVSDAEIGRVVGFWKKRTGEFLAEAPAGETTAPAVPWEGLEEEKQKDALMEDAIRVLREEGHASTTLLQRRLGIGYPRAARLMDSLEEAGVIGPADGSRFREVLLDDE